MSMHNKPCTVMEELGLIVHGFGSEIGKPSMVADIFRHGVAWGQKTTTTQIACIQEQLDHGMPFNAALRSRLSDLLAELVRTCSG